MPESKLGGVNLNLLFPSIDAGSCSMTPEELAARHPRLHHVTTPGAWTSISKLGLLSTSALLAVFEVEDARRVELTTKRRAAEVRLEHSVHDIAILNDNLPLSERALACCLDGGLLPGDWLRLLNTRVFFWPSIDSLARLLSAKMNRKRSREVLTFDTLGLVRAHAERVEISPINSGSTIRKSARRGADTLTPLLTQSYADWRRKRGGRDHVLEVIVRDGIPDISQYLVGIRTVEPPDFDSFGATPGKPPERFQPDYAC
ncbi:DUF7002 family protein [Rhodopila sp.]|uniref:DUF7002 family protein n=1 Tax=Rhodopila sp. TaxID=2480087 RepID=UPI003D11C5CD